MERELRICITGSEGYIGSGVKAALNEWEDCRRLFRRRTETPETEVKLPQITVLSIDKKTGKDLTDNNVVREIIEFAPNVIINLAAIVGEAACRKVPWEEVHYINAIIPAKLHFKCKNAKFYQASTGSVLGPTDKKQYPYAASKKLAEKYLNVFQAKPKVYILRFATVYGLNYYYASIMRWDILLNRMVHDAVQIKKITLPKNIKHSWRPLVSHFNLIKKIRNKILLENEPGGIENIGEFAFTIEKLALLVQATIKGMEILADIVPEIVWKESEEIEDLRNYTFGLTKEVQEVLIQEIKNMVTEARNECSTI